MARALLWRSLMLFRADSPLLAAIATTAIFAGIAWGLGLAPSDTGDEAQASAPAAPSEPGALSCGGWTTARTPPRETTW